MATRTAFSLTADDESEFKLRGAVANVAGNDRYTNAGLNNGVFRYPLLNDSFNVPFLQFYFLDAYGNIFSGERAPTVFLRMPNQFNISSFSEYSKTDNIFGAGSALIANQNKATYAKAQSQEGYDDNLMATYGLSAAEAFQTGIARAIKNVEGFLASGGMSNVAQFEFTARQAINPFSQLLYKGPQHRKYQIPVIMRPRSKKEADNIKNIIHTFRVASSPSVPSTKGIFEYIRSDGAKETIDNIGIGAGSTFTFGYPHLTKFDIIFRTPKQQVRIFKSKPCVIDSVAVDYGGQKLTFFEDGNVTEVQLTIQLTEIIPRTLADARIEAKNSSYTIA
jgi:hypothetical protein